MNNLLNFEINKFTESLFFDSAYILTRGSVPDSLTKIHSVFLKIIFIPSSLSIFAISWLIIFDSLKLEIKLMKL